MIRNISIVLICLFAAGVCKADGDEIAGLEFILGKCEEYKLRKLNENKFSQSVLLECIDKAKQGIDFCSKDTVRESVQIASREQVRASLREEPAHLNEIANTLDYLGLDLSHIESTEIEACIEKGAGFQSDRLTEKDLCTKGYVLEELNSILEEKYNEDPLQSLPAIINYSRLKDTIEQGNRPECWDK